MAKSTARQTDNSTWWKRKGKAEQAKALVQWGIESISVNLYRAQRAYQFASVFEGYSLTNLSTFGAVLTDEVTFDGLQIPIIRKTCRRQVMTFVNKATANDSPLPQFMTKGGSYEDVLRAENLDQAIVEEFGEEQGDFDGIHDMVRHGVMIASSATGRFWIFVLPQDGRPEAELDDGLTVGVVRNKPYGAIQTLVRTVHMDPDEAVSRWPSAEKEIMANVENVAPDIKSGKALRSRMDRENHTAAERRVVKITQGWRVHLRGKDGVQLFCLRNGHVLSHKKWTRNKVPACHWDFERELGGEGGTPLTQTIYRACMEQNRLVHDRIMAETRTPHVTWLVPRDGQGGEVKSQMQESKGIKIVECDDVNSAVRELQTPGFKRMNLELEAYFDQSVHDDSGIARNHTTGGGQQATSGIHESLKASYFTENFADQERRLVRFITKGVTTLFIWALQDTIDESYERWIGDDDFKKRITASDLDLDESKYIMKIAAASGEKDSPSARLQKADRMLQDPTIQFTGTDWVQFMKTMDVDRATQRMDALDQWADRQVRRWMKATPGDVKNIYQSPEKWMGIPALENMQLKVASEFANARGEGIPTYRESLFQKFLDDCVATIRQLKIEEAELAMEAQANVQARVTQGTPTAAPPPGPPTG